MHISTKCSIAIHCLVFIYEYGEKAKVTSELLSRSSGINPVTIRNILSSLKKSGIILVRSGTGGATISCPPDTVSLYDICKTLEPDFLDKLIGIHTNPSAQCPVGRISTIFWIILIRRSGMICEKVWRALRSKTLFLIISR